MPLDPSNPTNFAHQIVKIVLDILARQADQKQDQTISGQVTINPQMFQLAQGTTLYNDTVNMTAAQRQQYLAARGAHDKRHYTTGPIKFTNQFSGIPSMTFGQQTQPQSKDVSAPGVADDFVPFVVVPYVYTYNHLSTAVDGFYLGIYALTTPPPGLTKHYINWTARGPGSRYKGRGVKESWTQSYDLNQARFLSP